MTNVIDDDNMSDGRVDLQQSIFLSPVSLPQPGAVYKALRHNPVQIFSPSHIHLSIYRVSLKSMSYFSFISLYLSPPQKTLFLIHHTLTEIICKINH